MVRVVDYAGYQLAL